jgi:hypothetical protein
LSGISGGGAVDLIFGCETAELVVVTIGYREGSEAIRATPFGP